VTEGTLLPDRGLSSPLSIHSYKERVNVTTWRPDFDPSHLYFVTTTAVQRAHIFRRDVIKRILVDGLYHMHVVDRIELYAYVIMPNHIHFIIRCPP